jgi:hypothetical protein
LNETYPINDDYEESESEFHSLNDRPTLFSETSHVDFQIWLGRLKRRVHASAGTKEWTEAKL